MAPNLTPDTERTNWLRHVDGNLSGIIGHDPIRMWVKPITIRHWNVCKIPMNGISKKLSVLFFHTGSLFWNSAVSATYSSFDGKTLGALASLSCPCIQLLK